MAKPVVIVTGASKGIGLAVTRILLEIFGAVVVTISRTKTPELQELSDNNPSSVLAIEADVTDEKAITGAIALAYSTFSHVDGLVLNAGTLDPLGRIDAPGNTLDSWKTHFDVNFFSLVTAVKASLPALRQSKGKIVFVSSGAAVGGTAGWGPYNASKAAMNSLCRTLAQEEPDVVSVALRPGMVDTNMQLALREIGGSHMTETDYNKFLRVHAEGKLVKPEDAGHVIAALSLQASPSLSGQFVSWDSEQCKDYRRK
ncbi:hypothetical protein PLICRDRAFT_202634 [Plicaturopsis crispa FD-325 SS-3]|nr:hypothetical protein PLICRDRAFT_202634 [Plicaturopsis crispa FD-325 SS-3]